MALAWRNAEGTLHAVFGLLFQAACSIIDGPQLGELAGEDATGLSFSPAHFRAPPQRAGPQDARRCILAHSRGVKLIDATAHYITVDRDERPIFEPGVQRVDHTLPAGDDTAVRRGIARMVLAYAVHRPGQRRVLVNGHERVAFC